MRPHVPPFQLSGVPHSSPVPIPLPTSLRIAWLSKIPQPRPIAMVPKAPLISASSTRTSTSRLRLPFVDPNPSLLAPVMFVAYWKLPVTVMPSNSGALTCALHLLGFHPEVTRVSFTSEDAPSSVLAFALIRCALILPSKLALQPFEEVTSTA